MRTDTFRRTVSRSAPCGTVAPAVLLVLAVIASVLGFGSSPADGQGQTNSFLVVRAAGRSGGEYLEIVVNGNQIGSASLSGSSSLTSNPNWQNYFFAVSSSVAADDVTIRYTNDWGLGSDVRVDHIRLHNQTFETEAPGVITSGGWGNGANCGTGAFQTDYLACNGSIEYQGSNGSAGNGELRVILAGETGDERVNLRIGGTYIATMTPPASGGSFRSNPNWQEYTFAVDSTVTVDQIAVQFFNDIRRPGYDRNVRVDKIILHGATYETESSSVRTSGTWTSGTCRSGHFALDSMECNGQVTYVGATPSMPTTMPPTTTPPTPTTVPANGGQLAEDTKNRLAKTMNLGNALEAPSYEGEWGMVIQDWMFPTIKQAGFTAVRIPIRWSAHAQDSAPYTIDQQWFQRVDHVVAQARANDLAVIINMHHYEEINDNPFGHRDRFLGMWQQIARRYQNLPQSVSFELLNEPNGAIEPHWNSFAAQALDVVRESNPNRTVLIGPVGYNKFDRLQELVLPNDDNLVASVHYYEPFNVTHQQASWVTFSNGDLIYPNNQTCCDQSVEDQIRDDMATVAQWADGQDVPVIIGEFGVLDTADIQTQKDWTAHVRWRSQDQGFAWAYWEFGAGFGVFDRGACQWNQEIYVALMPQSLGSLDTDGVGCN